VRSLYHNYK